MAHDPHLRSMVQFVLNKKNDDGYEYTIETASRRNFYFYRLYQDPFLS